MFFVTVATGYFLVAFVLSPVISSWNTALLESDRDKLQFQDQNLIYIVIVRSLYDDTTIKKIGGVFELSKCSSIRLRHGGNDHLVGQFIRNPHEGEGSSLLVIKDTELLKKPEMRAMDFVFALTDSSTALAGVVTVIMWDTESDSEFKTMIEKVNVSHEEVEDEVGDGTSTIGKHNDVSKENNRSKLFTMWNEDDWREYLSQRFDSPDVFMNGQALIARSTRVLIDPSVFGSGNTTQTEADDESTPVSESAAYNGLVCPEIDLSAAEYPRHLLKEEPPSLHNFDYNFISLLCSFFLMTAALSLKALFLSVRTFTKERKRVRFDSSPGDSWSSPVFYTPSLSSLVTADSPTDDKDKIQTDVQDSQPTTSTPTQSMRRGRTMEGAVNGANGERESGDFTTTSQLRGRKGVKRRSQGDDHKIVSVTDDTHSLPTTQDDEYENDSTTTSSSGSSSNVEADKATVSSNLSGKSGSRGGKGASGTGRGGSRAAGTKKTTVTRDEEAFLTAEAEEEQGPNEQQRDLSTPGVLTRSSARNKSNIR